MPDIRRERKETAESLTEKKKDIKNQKILYFLFAHRSLVFVSGLFACFCFTERSKSFFGNQCITIDDWLIFLMHINAKHACEVLDS